MVRCHRERRSVFGWGAFFMGAGNLREIYIWLAAMSLVELETIAEQLQFHPDPWAVGARKLIAHEINAETRCRNQIFTF
jgi:hypothetical protein